MRRKITVIGAGNVGATTAQRLAERDYADIVLVDVIDDLPQGKALDLNQAGPVAGYEPTVVGTTAYEETAGSDIVIVTSGLGRQPGMSRNDLLARNKAIVSAVAEQIADRSPDAIVIVVTNPLDAMCHVVKEVTNFPRQRIIGMAGVLDSARFRTFIAWELGVSARDVTAFVLGGHGDTMVPVLSHASVSGIPVTELVAPDRLEEIVQRTRDGGAEVVGLLKQGGAYYAPSAGVAEIVDSIVLNQKRVLPCATLCQGEFGIRDLFVGVPVKLGAEGIVELIEIELADDERAALQRSAGAVQELVAAMAAV